MVSVIEGVLSIEQQADEIASSARQRAEAIERETRDAVAARRAELEAETTARIEAFRAEAAAKHQRELEAADAELREALARLDAMDARAIQAQAESVVARFREL